MAKNDDQPRDENGQFASTNSNGSKGENKEKRTAENASEGYTPFTGFETSYEDYIKENGNSKESFKNRVQYLKGKKINGKLSNQDREICFTAQSVDKISSKFTPVKGYFLGDMEKVIQNEPFKIEKGREGKKNGYEMFYTYGQDISKKINGKTKNYRVEVGVGKKKKKLSAYTLTAKELSDTPSNDSSLISVGKSLFVADSENIEDFLEIVNLEVIEINHKAKDMNIVLDKNTKRHIDANGFMHVSVSNISKEIVNPYYGYEIPNHTELGLDPDKVYNVYRTGKALEEGAKSFNNLPLMRDHYIDSAESPQREHRVGCVGSDCAFRSPYLQAI